ncbi:uncharacterized protein LOC130646066 [Hydractinia symbiolongicarpus]|uniref:uncharacterized protein LOC130646066 n=1 Tax=Hydractinia symbiolongicarpus TaxID=13093 RepID=UPI00254D9526|nr:uncharacterized protein LOC130646066 [Hydractinia symbiolongicarpus]
MWLRKSRWSLKKYKLSRNKSFASFYQFEVTVGTPKIKLFQVKCTSRCQPIHVSGFFADDRSRNSEWNSYFLKAMLERCTMHHLVFLAVDEYLNLVHVNWTHYPHRLPHPTGSNRPAAAKVGRLRILIISKKKDVHQQKQTLLYFQSQCYIRGKRKNSTQGLMMAGITKFIIFVFILSVCWTPVSSRYFEDYEDEDKDLSYDDSDEGYDDDDDYNNDRDLLEDVLEEDFDKECEYGSCLSQRDYSTRRANIPVLQWKVNGHNTNWRILCENKRLRDSRLCRNIGSYEDPECSSAHTMFGKFRCKSLVNVK